MRRDIGYRAIGSQAQFALTGFGAARWTPEQSEDYLTGLQSRIVRSWNNSTAWRSGATPGSGRKAAAG